MQFIDREHHHSFVPQRYGDEGVDPDNILLYYTMR
jgi:hypothetical protein